MPTLNYYVIQTTFNPGVWIKVDEHEYEQLNELGRIEGVPIGPVNPSVFDTEVADLLADVNSLARAVIAGIPPDPHTHIATDITDSGSVGRALLAATTALTARTAIGAAPLDSPAFTGTPTGITKSHVGLGSVDNTADTAKPVSTAQATALALKAPLASPAFTGTPTGITKTHVGLANVDNTSDVNKPVSTAQATADATKMPHPGADPNADRIIFWDDSASAFTYLTPGTNLVITGTTIDASGGGSSPTYANLPNGTVESVVQNGDGTWPARRSTRPSTDQLHIFVKMVAGSADPALVTSPSVAGMYSGDLVTGA